MGIAIAPYSSDHAGALNAFNRRLSESGITYRFPDALPPEEPAPVRKHAFVAVDREAHVRGGYLVQEQTFWINGRERTAGFLQLPLSEGLISRQYSMVGAQLLAHASRRQPLLFGLGIGGRDQTIAKLVLALGWEIAPVPFLFKLVRPFRVARGLDAVRRTPWRRLALDVAAFSGLAAAASVVAARRARAAVRAVAERAGGERAGGELGPLHELGDGDPQCTALWERHRGVYRFAARRDADTIAQLYPAGSRFLRWAYRRGPRLTGWVIALDTGMRGHSYFGNLRVGTIVDCFGDPDDADPMIAAATKMLAGRGVDLIVSNQASGIWTTALGRAGFSEHTSNYLFAVSPALRRELGMPGTQVQDCHLTRGDGDGPLNL
ncbi:MAG: hypothetical protein IT184_09500 [Acidobacteria bacterium]|nr:hypothetical protein [Acidobacteriota bacterium]